MKTLILTIAVLLTTSFAAFAQSNEMNKVSLSKQPFIVSFEALEKYLDLSFEQLEDVRNINNFFIATQKKYVKTSSEIQSEKMQQTVYANIKLLKEVLSAEQYRKYIGLINVTNYNRLLSEKTNESDNIYYAKK